MRKKERKFWGNVYCIANLKQSYVYGLISIFYFFISPNFTFPALSNKTAFSHQDSW